METELSREREREREREKERERERIHRCVHVAFRNVTLVELGRTKPENKGNI